ncbi:uncharacterized protein LOC110412913 [Herrania umbratica]|uniref:Uncharacterized protein LOC110412913 n=1 Tax=Herrania umbratica TaxID=108875 RepID=A0A6J0ZWN2_9ROSI|nr:uncharacterized protein LOC110412913 [Herrania umbratica]
MDSKPKPVYEDFEVQTEWVNEASGDALVASVPVLSNDSTGFKREQLKVQISSGGNLRIPGECSIGENKFSRFHQEIPIPSNWDRSKINAKVMDGILQIKHPKVITSAEKQEEAKPSEEVPQSPEELPHKQKNGPEHAVQESSPKATMENLTGEETNEAAKDVSEKAPDKEDMKDKKADIVAAAKEANVTMDGTGIHQQLGIIKQAFDGLVMALKNPSKVMNMVLVAFLAVLLALFVIDGIRSLGNYYNEACEKFTIVMGVREFVEIIS